MTDESIDPMIGYLCENTNFRLCRLAGYYENGGCEYSAIPSTGIPKVLAVVHLAVAVVVGLVFCFALGTFREYKVDYQYQIPTRGKWFYRIHLILMGISIVLWGVEMSLIPIDGTGLHFMICLRFVFLNAAEVLLVCIALIDTHIIGAGKISFIVCIIISAIIGLLSFLMMVSSLATNLIAIFGIGIPIGCALFHMLSMIGVCCIRKMMKALVYVILMGLFNALPIVMEMFVNQPLCTVTNGWLPGATLGCIFYAIYRVLIYLYYELLKKKGERFDGTHGKRILLGDEDGNMDIPAQICVEDYTYEYTYSEVDEDNYQGF